MLSSTGTALETAALAAVDSFNVDRVLRQFVAFRRRAAFIWESNTRSRPMAAAGRAGV